MLSWTERCRSATAMRRRPPRPPSDTEIASCLTKLRFTVSQVEEAALNGADTKRLLRQQAALEAEIRQKTRHARDDDSDDEGPPSISQLRAALGDAVLVEMVESDETLFAVVLSRKRVRLCPLGPIGPVTNATFTLRFALARMANRRLSAASSEAALLLARQTAGELDRMLLLPLRRQMGDHPLVLAPTGVLHALPWMALPSCRGRPVTVCPSAGLWLRGTAVTAPPERTSRILLVAGPGLTHARAEVDELSRVYPGAETLVGSQSTTARFTRAATGADLVHVAAHGSYRDDNPLLSSLRLADGPVTVYDFELLRPPPRCLILSACDGGLSEVHPGEELMGLSAGLLGSGTKVLVASVTSARDVTSRSLMVAFHRLLSAGASPAQALADAQEALRRDDPEEAFGAAGFVCFGAGLNTV